MLDSYCVAMNVALFKCPLALRPHYGWGGRRTGAGRKPGAASPVPHRPRRGMAARFPARATVRLLAGAPSLRTMAVVRTIERSFAEARERGDFRLVHYSLQNTHAHLIVEADDAGALARGMMAIGARIVRAVNRVFGRRGRVLAERFHLHALRTPREVRAALAYVLLNARRHARQLVGVPRLDPASSGRWFDGWRWKPPASANGMPVIPVARARAWLLTIGWRRHGLIDPSEVPAGKA